MPPSCVNSGNENVTEREPKGGVGSCRRPSLPRARNVAEPPPGTYVRQPNRLGEAVPVAAASSPPIEPLERRRFVSKTLNVDAVLAPYQFDVLMGDAQLLGISDQRDLM